MTAFLLTIPLSPLCAPLSFLPLPYLNGPLSFLKSQKLKSSIIFQFKSSSEQRQPFTIDIKPSSCSELRAIVKVFPKSLEKFTEEFKIVLGGLPWWCSGSDFALPKQVARFNSLSGNYILHAATKTQYNQINLLLDQLLSHV